ncbi:universal stress protein [Rahnella aquatilis]|uniref:Universal stress protein UspA-like protein n=1 Tax=Rahnella aquatilis (strain ATCC 33071 / DSM 4594 / JCM 1683 / NBRC 105701 / NCIMB 13365 / CIP 78.65) TaxID=745277 RepID=H2IUY4_RAHAC|nr:universal stress protein [Rahnella aquatilis]AEX52840.1 universal stress protein UspA-like protein [Rahnella aquatilis CIP 78.65 = ATCC 33071]KFD05395.1 UspA family protein [Rahnella aquatilis CIP 78.65 = ATCC 33071]
MFDVILLAVDGSKQSPFVIDLARQLAKGQASTVFVTCCIDESYALENNGDASGEIVDYPPAEEEQNTARAVVGQAVETLLQAGIRARGNLIVGPAGEALVAEAERLNASLIVIGHRQLSAFGRMMKGSVSAEVIAAASCPVMVEVRGN